MTCANVNTADVGASRPVSAERPAPGAASFAPALFELFGEAAKGFSPTNIIRFLRGWESEYQAFQRRDLDGFERLHPTHSAIDIVHSIHAATSCLSG